MKSRTGLIMSSFSRAAWTTAIKRSAPISSHRDTKRRTSAAPTPWAGRVRTSAARWARATGAPAAVEMTASTKSCSRSGK